MPNKRKIINDPVHGFIRIPNELVFEILQHPYVQRLGRIKQLGVSNFVYPGAVHTRLMHSIGAMHLASEAIRNLREKGVEISDNERTSVMAAMLLHDVGHGPFSHVLENTLVEGITHEEISLLMMEQINRDLTSSTQLNLQGEVERPLDEAIAIYRNEYPRRFLHQLISSQLDMDRMDYLCRDSFFCGVAEGSIATERLLKMLNVSGDRLVIDHKGIYSVEKFLVARRLMYWQVYLHKTSVAAEQVLIQLLRRAKELAHQGTDVFGTPALRYFLYNDITAKDFYPGSEAMRMYALLDDTDIQSAMKVWMNSDDIVLSKLAEAYTNRRLFKAKEVMVNGYGLQVTEEIEQLKRDYMQRFGISAHEAEFFYSPHTITSHTYSAADDQIDILYPNGDIRNIADASDMWSMAALTRKVERNYIYYYQ